MLRAYIIDAVHDVWRILRRQSLPGGRIDRYAIVLIVIIWTSVATVAFGLGVTWSNDLGTWEHPVVAATVLLSWPAIAVGGSLLTYRRIHRR